MLFQDTVFIGIDPRAGIPPATYAVLDKEQNLIALSQGNLDEVQAFVAGQQKAYIGINAPRRPNQGLMAQDEFRQHLNPQPRPGRWTKYRYVEYRLRLHNIYSYRTPGKINNCPGWMVTGFNFYAQLESTGCKDYPDPKARLQMMEVYPHACYCVMLGNTPYSKRTLEGRLQRQLLLFEHGLKIKDPMDFFEEVTRYRILRGTLPLTDIYSANELDALVAASSVWMAVSKPEKTITLGDPTEGQVILPAGTLKSHY